MCGCQGAAVDTSQQQYTVTLPDGTQKVVQGEPQAKIEITAAGGGSYVKN